MPWKVALEINAVVREGALLLVTSHPAWPPHELPWDYWRFTCSAFQSLFNQYTGWQIVRCSEGLPGVIIPLATDDSMREIHRMRVGMGVAFIARKVGPPDSRLAWDLAAADVTATTYPLPPS